MTKEDAIDVLKHNYPSACFTDLCDAVEIAIQALSAQSEIIRCKDCKYRNYYYCTCHHWDCDQFIYPEVDEDNYCSYGERRTENV